MAKLNVYKYNHGTDWVLFKVKHETNLNLNSFLPKLQNCHLFCKSNINCNFIIS